MSDLEVYEQARQEWMESGDSKGEMWDQAMRHHTNLVLDDMRKRPELSLCRHISEFLNAYEKDRNEPE